MLTVNEKTAVVKEKAFEIERINYFYRILNTENELIKEKSANESLNRANVQYKNIFGKYNSQNISQPHINCAQDTSNSELEKSYNPS